MSKSSPKRNMDALEMTVAALQEFAPTIKFGGVDVTDFEPLVETCRQDRDAMVNHDNAGKGLLVNRENHDLSALEMRDLIINGVIGDPKFGPDSALYEALGYVRKSDRKSGLTRKKVTALKK